MPSRRAIRPSRFVRLTNERRLSGRCRLAQVGNVAALAKAALPPPAAKAFVEAVGSTIEEAITADNFEAGKQLAAAGLSMAKRAKEAEAHPADGEPRQRS